MAAAKKRKLKNLSAGAAWSRSIPSLFRLFFCLAILAILPDLPVVSFWLSPAPAQAATYTVTTDADADPAPAGSLREAITLANANPGPDTIEFDAVAHSGDFFIQPATVLPDITDDATTIDGSTAAPNTVTIDGSLAVDSYYGLTFLSSDDNVIIELIIVNFIVPGGSSVPASGGIKFDRSNNNLVKGCYLGNDGDAILANLCGILIYRSSNNIIGGSTPDSRNIISGNSGAYGGGIVIQGTSTASTYNTIEGNYIGTDKDGTDPLPNSAGIDVGYAASHTTIGGTNTIPGTLDAGNIISGNSNGINIGSWGANNTEIIGNHIGVDKDGTAAIPNDYGIFTISYNEDTIIGGTEPGKRNVISGNTTAGLYFAEGSYRHVLGNYIGVDATGTAAVPNGNGIILRNLHCTIGGATENERNIISGNAASGIVIRFSGTAERVISGNYIGPDVTGEAVPTGSTQTTGIYFYDGADNVVIGGATDGERNIVSGNTGYGISLVNSGTDSNTISGNYIGTKANGTEALPNQYGIGIEWSAASNTIGGASEDERNIISGNSVCGIYLGYEATTNSIEGNYIGLDKDGANPISNNDGIYISTGAIANTVGGSTEEQRNIISGNSNTGITIFYEGTDNNVVSGNYIGTDPLGSSAMANGTGVYIVNGPAGNTIGGDSAGERNVISGNTNYGVYITGADTTGNTVSGNYIGTDSAGTAALANQYGVYISAPSNTIGGDNTVPGTLDLGNVIAGNTSNVIIDGSGTDNNVVSGNYIGINSTGTAVLPTNLGVFIGGGANNNTIGGTTPGRRNIISGHSSWGMLIPSSGTTNNNVYGNYIGTDASGTLDLGNSKGILIQNGAQYNNIGGPNTVPGVLDYGNVISGNSTAVEIQGPSSDTSYNVVAGNYIGTQADGLGLLGNGNAIVITDNAQANIVGGDTGNHANIIANNSSHGIICEGASTIHNTFRMNSIFNNSGLGINLYDGANEGIAAPIFDSGTYNASGGTVTVTGTVSGDPTFFPMTVEFFWTGETPDAAGEGKEYLGSVSVPGPSGSFSAPLDVSSYTLPIYISATVTNTNGSTSEFAANAEVQETPYTGPPWYVDSVSGNDLTGNGGPLADGHTPWKTLTYAMTKYDDGTIHSGDMIYVAGSTLGVSYNYNIASGETFPITMKNVLVYGSTPSDTLPVTEFTLAEADGCIVDADDTNRVFLVSGITTGQLSGLTITDGTTANGGGGILISNSVFKVDDSIVSYNRAGNGSGEANGGGIRIEGNSSVDIDNCSIVYNTATAHSGGGIGIEGNGGSSPQLTLTDTDVSHNSVVHFGGGIDVWAGAVSGGGSPQLTATGCTFSYNTGHYAGGGVFARGTGATADYTECTFFENTQVWGGGADNGWYSLANYDRCVFHNNHATDPAYSGQSGGGLRLQHGGEARNCLIYGNNSGSGGGGGGVVSTGSQLTNCTIAGNSTTGNGAGVYIYPSGASTITNCLIAQNTGAYEYYADGGGPHLVTYTDIWDDSGGDIAYYLGDTCTAASAWSKFTDWGFTGSRSANPLFLPTAGSGSHPVPSDYYLDYFSPCVDTGTTSGMPATDIEGTTRPHPSKPPGTAPSMGAYEVMGSSVPPGPYTAYYVDEMCGNDSNSGYSWGTGYALETVAGAISKANADGAPGLIAIYIAGNNTPLVYSDPPIGDGSGARSAYVESSDLDLIPAAGGSFSLIAGELADGETWDTSDPYDADPTTGIDPTVIITLSGGARIHAEDAEAAYPISIKGLRIQQGGGIDFDNCQSALTIKDCYINDNSSAANGGGVFANDSPAGGNILEECVLRKNVASVSGGGLSLEDSRFTVKDCLFAQNSSAAKGGGIFSADADSVLTVTGTNFAETNSSGLGGGIAAGGGTVSVTDSAFDDCRATTGSGGGIFIDPGITAATISTSTFNICQAASGYGGGAYIDSTSASLSRCQFTANTASGGGGLYWGDSAGSATNSYFYQNGGGEIRVAGNPAISFCTLASTAGTGIYFDGAAAPTVTNSIISGSGGYRLVAESQDSSPAVTYCDIYNSSGAITCFEGDGAGNGWEGSYKKLAMWGWDGIGCFSIAPEFSSGYNLAGSSPCINAGAGSRSEDLDGSLSGFDTSHPDLGCDEFTSGNTMLFTSTPQSDLITGVASAAFTMRVISPAGTELYTPGIVDFRLYDADGTVVDPHLYSLAGGSGSYTLTYNQDRQPYQLQVRAGYPPSSTVSQTSQSVRFIGAKGKNFYVDPATGNDETGDGNNANKWKDLSWALWCLRNPEYDSIVNLAAGTYDKGPGPLFQEYPGTHGLFEMIGTSGDGDISLKGGENLPEAGSYILTGVNLTGSDIERQKPVLYVEGLTNEAFLKGLTLEEANNGFRFVSSSAKVTGCLIQDNAPMFSPFTAGNGGVITNGSPYFYNCRFKNNRSTGVTIPGLGGGVRLMGTENALFDRCYFEGNSANYGGAVAAQELASADLINCLFFDNLATTGPGAQGGAGYLEDGTLRFHSSTIADNTAGGTGGAFMMTNTSTLTLTNTLVVDNTGTNQIAGTGTPTLTATYSDLYPNTTSGVTFTPGSSGNISADPNFAGGGSYDLVYPSPAADTGTRSGAPAEDIEGRGRPFGEGYDMGAYEARFVRTKVTTLPQRIYAGVPSEAFIVTLYNGDGTLYTGGATLTLTSSSELGWFSAARKPFSNVTSLTISAGSASGTFYYRDKKEGQVVLTITPPSTSWAPAHVTLTVYPRPFWMEEL